MILEKKTIDKFGYSPSTLSKGSNKIIVCKCDYCGKICEKKYFKWNKGREYVQKDSCANKECRLQKQEANNLVKRGVKHHSQTDDYKVKYKKTCLKKYGVDNPFKDKEKIKKAVKEKYGVSNVALLDSVKDKKIKTNLERYGVEHPYQNSEILSKVHKKIREKYGVEFYAQTDEFKEVWGSKNKLSEEDLLNSCALKGCRPLFDLQEYNSCRDTYSFECVKHGITFHTQFHYLRHPIKNQCPKCKNNGTSLYEQEISQYIKTLSENVETGTRRVISPYELDCFLPEKKIAIEFNGLYWHSETFKDKKYHLNKFKECEKQGIKLLQIFEDEWRDKSHIWKSILKVNLGLVDEKYYARKLSLHSGNSRKVVKFFNDNHLSGNAKYITAFWLEDDNGEVVCALSVRHPFVKDKENCLEIARFASKVDRVVVGGFSKLLKSFVAWASERKYTQILTYSDCRYSWGDLYRNSGFELEGSTQVSYDYTDLVNRFNRFNYRATKSKTEREVAAVAGVRRIYSVGNYRWKLSLV